MDIQAILKTSTSGSKWSLEIEYIGESRINSVSTPFDSQESAYKYGEDILRNEGIVKDKIKYA